MKLPSLDSLFLKAVVTFKRFPLAIIAAIIGTWYSILLERLPYDLTDTHYYYKNIIMTCYLGMLLFIVTSIYSERKKLSSNMATVLQIAAAAIIIGYYFTLPRQFMVISFTRFLLFTLILHLLISFIPFLVKNEVNGFWQYNKILFIRILTSGLYTLVLYLGLILALLAIDKLFNANIKYHLYFDIWALLIGIFNTWFFLSGIPANFSELEFKKDYPKGLKIFTQYVLLPLISIYLIILYAYMFKIIFKAEWPVGWVSYLVIGFSTGGIFSLLLIYPVRNDENNKWILIFSRFFYFALFPLIILLFFAVERRIGDYGITEHRYFILVLALWLLFIASYFLFSKSKSIKLIPVSLCILALAVSFGPWSAFNISLASQNNHLKSLLQKNAMLTDGKIIKAKSTISFKDHKEISSIISYLVEVHGYKTLQPLFVQNLDSIFKNNQGYNYGYDYSQVNKIHSMINLTQVYDYETDSVDHSDRYVSFYSDKTNNITNVAGYDFMVLNFTANDYDQNDTSCKAYSLGQKDVLVCFDYKKKLLNVSNKNKQDSSLIFDVGSLIDSLEKENSDNNSVPAEKMTLNSENTLIKAKVIFEDIHFQKRKNVKDQFGLNANILIQIH